MIIAEYFSFGFHTKAFPTFRFEIIDSAYHHRAINTHHATISKTKTSTSNPMALLLLIMSFNILYWSVIFSISSCGFGSLFNSSDTSMSANLGKDITL